MKFNKESKILAAIALLCITTFLFSFTKKEETYKRYNIETAYKDGATIYVLTNANGDPVNFMYK
jgi:hypothetical protein